MQDTVLEITKAVKLTGNDRYFAIYKLLHQAYEEGKASGRASMLLDVKEGMSLEANA